MRPRVRGNACMVTDPSSRRFGFRVGRQVRRPRVERSGRRGRPLSSQVLDMRAQIARSRPRDRALRSTDRRSQRSLVPVRRHSRSSARRIVLQIGASSRSDAAVEGRSACDELDAGSASVDARAISWRGIPRTPPRPDTSARGARRSATRRRPLDEEVRAIFRALRRRRTTDLRGQGRTGDRSLAPPRVCESAPSSPRTPLTRARGRDTDCPARTPRRTPRSGVE